MKKKLNIYCSLMILICLVLITFNLTDRITECYNLGKGMYREVSDSNWWLTKMIFWAADMNVLLIAGVVFILVIRNINKKLVFDWKNIRLFRALSMLLFLHFLLSTGVNYIDSFVGEVTSQPSFKLYTAYILDYLALIAALFTLIIAEVFAVGLRIQEEQELTI